MSYSINAKKHSLDNLTIIGGIVIALDTLFGILAILGLDLKRPNELLMGISFVLGLPVYILDVRHNNRVAIGLWILFLVRWIARCFGGATPTICSPFVWPVGILLFTAVVLLQISKLRQPA
jgi:hypothetical protein